MTLGVFAGVVAAIAILPTSIPLLYRLVLAETSADGAEIYSRVARIGYALQHGVSLPPIASKARHLHAVNVSGGMLLHQGTLEPDAALEDLVCGEPVGVMRVAVQGQVYAAGCYENAQVRVFGIWDDPARSYFAIGAFVVAIAAIAGIVTAMGVLQVLRPITKLADALVRVGAGNRHVRMEMTGIAELDELVLTLNAAASAVEEREHHILGRVQVVQEMARLVAHEVRNPLQSLELLTTLVAEETDPAERRLLAGNIHTEIRTLDDVVTRLLREGTTRGALRLQMRPTDVTSVVLQVCAIRTVEAQRKKASLLTQLEYVGDADLDRAMFGRCLENLVANAIRAVEPEQGVVRISTSADGPTLVVHVDDNGPGVDPALGDAVFEPNVSGTSGSGLGLSLARGVVEGHGGTIRLGTSELGGARFELRLPRNAATAAMR